MEHERTCFFIGHREANERVLPALEQAVEQLIVESGVTDFVVGHYGAFDGMAVTVEEEEPFSLIKEKHFQLKPMDVEEAILQMNLLGHSFFVYRDAQQGAVCVVYHRKDGGYGQIVAE